VLLVLIRHRVVIFAAENCHGRGREFEPRRPRDSSEAIVRNHLQTVTTDYSEDCFARVDLQLEVHRYKDSYK
jgi:hypothetical protein